MIAYTYLENYFRAVLSGSKQIQGRFYICPEYLAEINTTNLQQVVSRTIEQQQLKKYPLALMLPPRMYGDLSEGRQTHEYLVQMVFVQQIGLAQGGFVRNMGTTLKSGHTIVQDWQDMARVAVNFVRQLAVASRDAPTRPLAYPSQKRLHQVDPISFLGSDETAGVFVQFSMILHNTCEVEDYPEDFVSQLQVPTEDPHPEHLP